MLRLALLSLLVTVSMALKCQDLDLLCSGAHPIEFSFTLNYTNIPSFDGSAYIWAKTGTVVTSQTESITCQEYTNYLLISTNGIPNHNVGKFPFTISTVGRPHGDNPNTIQAQNYQWKIPKTPVVKTTKPTKNIMTDFGALSMGPIGFALNGVPIFNPFNAQRQDAVDPTSGGFEVMDLCDGHPQKQGGYHYHHQGPKAGCLFTDMPGQHSPKIGYAFDGIPVYGPLSDNGIKPTDLDICNGRTHPSLGYIYHVTELKAPYMIGCYMYQTTDAVRGGTISTQGATAIGGVSSSCSAKIGQAATKSTATTSKPGSTTTKPSTGTVSVGGSCPTGLPAMAACPTACSTNTQCTSAGTVCCKPGSCTQGKCIRPCPVMQCQPCSGTRQADLHGCPTCTCSTTGSGTTTRRPMMTSRPRTGTGSRKPHSTRPFTGTGTRMPPSSHPHTGTGSRKPHSTRPFTGTGTHRPPSSHAHTGTGSRWHHSSHAHTGSRKPTTPAVQKPTGNQVSAGNNGLTTPSTGQSAPKDNTVIIVSVVSAAAVAVAAVFAILYINHRRKMGKTPDIASTYKELQDGE